MDNCTLLLGASTSIRNLLCNPHVRLAILNANSEDRNSWCGSVLARSFFRNGFEAGKSDTGRDCWLIKSAIFGYIDIEIAAEALELLRHSIEWKDKI